DGMGLTDIDRQELDLILVTAIQSFQDPKLGSIRPSGKAAEDKHDRLLAAIVAQVDGPLAVMRLEGEARSAFADGRPLEERTKLPRQQAVHHHLQHFLR